MVGAATIGMSFVGDIGQLADTTVLLLVLVFIATNISCLVLRNDTVEHEHFTVPKVVPVVAVVASIALLTQQDGTSWVLAGFYLVVGTILFFIAQAGRKSLGDERPGGIDLDGPET